jgi:hypothetical protein
MRNHLALQAIGSVGMRMGEVCRDGVPHSSCSASGWAIE